MQKIECDSAPGCTLQLFAIELMLVQAIAVCNVQLGKIMQKIECDVTLAAVQLLPIKLH